MRNRALRYAVEQLSLRRSGGDHSHRRTGEHAGRRRPGMDEAIVGKRATDSRHLLRHAAHGARRRRELVKLDRVRIRPGDAVVVDRGDRRSSPASRTSRAFGCRTATSRPSCRPAFAALASTARCAVAAIGRREDADLRRAIPSGGRAHGAGRTILENFLHEIAGLGRRLEDGIVRRPCRSRDSRARRQRQRDLRAFRRRRFGRRRDARRARDRRAAHLHLRRSRACCARTKPTTSWPRFATLLHLNVVAVDARDRFLQKLAGIVDPEEKRVIIGHEFIADLRRRSQEDSRRQVLRARDALSRRHRVEDAAEQSRATRSNRITTSAGCPSGWSCD